MKLVNYKNNKKYEDIIISYEDADNVLISIFFKGGNSLDKKQLGIAHLVEHSIFLNKDSVALFDLGFGTDFNAITDSHCINLGFSFAIDYDKPLKDELRRFGTALNFLSELIMKENFNFSDLENEKNVIYNESINGIANDLQNAYLSFIWNSEQKHIDGFDNNISLSYGCKETLSQVGVEEIHKFKEKYFTKENMAIMIKCPFKEKDVKKIIKEHFIDKFKSNKETEFLYQKHSLLDYNKYYISKQKSDYVNITAYLTFNNNVKINEACLVSDMMNAYANDSSYNKLTRNIDMNFRKEGLVYQINFAQPLILGDNIGFHFNFETKKENLKKVLIHSARYIRECFEKISYEEEITEYLGYVKEESEANEENANFQRSCSVEDDKEIYPFDEGYDSEKEFLAFLEKFEEKFVYSVLPSQDMFDEIVYTYKNYSPADISSIIGKLKDNSNLKFIIAGDIELSELPDIELLNDIASGRFKSARDYFGNMQRDVFWKKKVDCLKNSKSDVIETRAITCVGEENRQK